MNINRINRSISYMFNTLKSHIYEYQTYNTHIHHANDKRYLTTLNGIQCKREKSH